MGDSRSIYTHLMIVVMVIVWILGMGDLVDLIVADLIREPTCFRVLLARGSNRWISCSYMRPPFLSLINTS